MLDLLQQDDADAVGDGARVPRRAAPQKPPEAMREELHEWVRSLSPGMLGTVLRFKQRLENEHTAAQVAIGAWVPLIEAARLLDVRVDALRARCAGDWKAQGLARQGRTPTRPNGKPGWFVSREADPRLRAPAT